MNGRGDVLCIGTTETRNIVGLGLDQRLLAEAGVTGWTIVAAVSAQDDGGLRDLVPVSATSLRAQFDVVDRPAIGAIRIGALPTIEAIAIVGEELARYPGVPVVLDPVLATSRGGRLGVEPTAEALRDLARHVTIVLPNLSEAAALTGRAVVDGATMLAAAATLVHDGAYAALVTGGHLAGDPVDHLVVRGFAPRTFVAPRIAREVRGTGCTLALALAVELALGKAAAVAPHERDRAGSEGVTRTSSVEDGTIAAAASLVSAIERARQVVRTKIAHARRVGDQWVVAPNR